MSAGARSGKTMHDNTLLFYFECSEKIPNKVVEGENCGLSDVWKHDSNSHVEIKSDLQWVHKQRKKTGDEAIVVI